MKFLKFLSKLLTSFLGIPVFVGGLRSSIRTKSPANTLERRADWNTNFRINPTTSLALSGGRGTWKSEFEWKFEVNLTCSKASTGQRVWWLADSWCGFCTTTRIKDLMESFDLKVSSVRRVRRRLSKRWVRVERFLRFFILNPPFLLKKQGRDIWVFGQEIVDPCPLQRFSNFRSPMDLTILRVPRSEENEGYGLGTQVSRLQSSVLPPLLNQKGGLE